MPHPFHAQCACPCRKERPPRRVRLHCHGVCPRTRPKRQPLNGADQIRPKVPKLAPLMDSAEQDVLAYMTLPKPHWTKLHSTNPIERLNGEIKRRTEVVGIFPNDEAIVRLVGALLLEQNDEWAVQRSRYMALETIATMSNDPSSVCRPQADTHPALWDQPWSSKLHRVMGHYRSTCGIPARSAIACKTCLVRRKLTVRPVCHFHAKL